MKTILVADDIASSRELIRTFVEHCGYTVIEAANGREAILLAREKTPDLLLVDLHMPMKDGFEVFTEVHSDPACRSIPIVAITGSATRREQERALAHGFNACLAKPLCFSDVRRALSRMLSES